MQTIYSQKAKPSPTKPHPKAPEVPKGTLALLFWQRLTHASILLHPGASLPPTRPRARTPLAHLRQMAGTQATEDGKAPVRITIVKVQGTAYQCDCELGPAEGTQAHLLWFADTQRFDALTLYEPLASDPQEPAEAEEEDERRVARCRALMQAVAEDSTSPEVHMVCAPSESGHALHVRGHCTVDVRMDGHELGAAWWCIARGEFSARRTCRRQ